MAVTLGGSLGVTFPDATTTLPANVTSQFTPMITDTANVMVIKGGVRAIGSSGVFANGALATTASNRVAIAITISADTSNYTLNTAKAPGYSAGKTDVTLTINSGVNVYSASTGSYALTVNTTWNAADTVTIVNNGTIIGRGGNGSIGGAGGGGTPGTAAGPALLVQRATTINNVNRIAGGGGGGGGGGGYSSSGPKWCDEGGGGGGGGGIGNSTGGPGYAGCSTSGSPGSAGTLSANGGGGGGGSLCGPGGPGGTYGTAGSSGSSGLGGGGGSGGAAGAAVVGNSFITWTATGTRNGSIS